MLVPDYPIRTERLALRPFVATDLTDFRAYDSLPEVARYLYWEAHDLRASQLALGRKTHQVALRREGDRLTLAVVLTGADRVIGEVMLKWGSREHRQGEIGFVFNPEFQGRGLATEAVPPLLDLGFYGLGLHRITGRCDGRNARSAAVMERVGMRREAHLVHNERFKGGWGDELIYAMLDREWQAAGETGPMAVDSGPRRSSVPVRGPEGGPRAKGTTQWRST